MLLHAEETGRSFRIVESELQFLRKMKLPLPSVNPTLRMLKLVMFSPMCKKYQTTCAKCGKDMESLLNPKDGYIFIVKSVTNRRFINYLKRKVSSA